MQVINRMFKGAKTWSPFVGCEYDCTFCAPSFKAQMKRRVHDCKLCASYTPHFHPERLGHLPDSKLIFAFAFCDPNFMKLSEVTASFNVMRCHLDRTFLVQSKSSTLWGRWEKAGIEIPSNVVIGATIESNMASWFPWNYNIQRDNIIKYNDEISYAPLPLARALALATAKHPRKYPVIEPALDFEPRAMVDLIKPIRPEFAYIGYDTHHSLLRNGRDRLPEPTLSKTWALIRELKKVTEVRIKTLRKAWYER